MASERTTRHLRVNDASRRWRHRIPAPACYYYRRWSGNRADTDRYFGLLDGSVPVQEVFTPRNVERIVAGAAPVLSTAA